jgi:hypothetical protein
MRTIAAIGLIAGATAFFAFASSVDPDSVPDSQVVRTVKHDGHWLIMARQGVAFMHHPDCPCGKSPERERGDENR